MIIDKQNTLSDSQAVTAAARSTNVIDLGAARDLGMSPKQLCITCTETAASAGATTVQFQLQCDSDEAFGSAKTVIETAAIPKATLVAGYQIFLPLPIGLDERYMSLYYNVATADLTAGKFSAQIVDQPQANKAYPDAL